MGGGRRYGALLEVGHVWSESGHGEAGYYRPIILARLRVGTVTRKISRWGYHLSRVCSLAE